MGATSPPSARTLRTSSRIASLATRTRSAWPSRLAYSGHRLWDDAIVVAEVHQMHNVRACHYVKDRPRSLRFAFVGDADVSHIARTTPEPPRDDSACDD